MKKNILILAIFFANITEDLAQFYNKGAQVVIQNGVVLKVDGDFLNDINSNFRNDSKVILNGNITNNQTMANAFAGLWELSGAGSQNIDGISPLFVNDIKFDNIEGFELDNVIKINNHGSFVNGLVVTFDFSPLIFLPNATIPLAPTDASHVVGPVAKLGTAPFTFPIGDTDKYQPIKADFSINTDGLLAKYIVGNAGTGNFTGTGTETTALIGYNSNEYWDLQPFNEGNTSAEITLYWDNYNDSYPNEVAQRRVAHKVGNDWLNEGQAATASGTAKGGSVKSNLLSDWSPFTLGFVQATALPLRLLSFSAKTNNDINQLNWVTANEIGVSHFEIEKSQNGNLFEKIGEVKAKGGPTENVNYEFFEQQTNSEIGVYYRLKIVDLDSKYNYSKIVYLKNNTEQNTVSEAFPNPATDSFTNFKIIANSAGEWQISHLDMAGRLLFSEKTNLNSGYNILKINNLVKGLNLIQIQNQSNIFMRKVMR